MPQSQHEVTWQAGACGVTCEPRAAVGDNVQQCLWQEAVPSKALQEDVPLPLGQLPTVLVQQQWEVAKPRGLPAKGFVEKQVLGS